MKQVNVLNRTLPGCSLEVNYSVESVNGRIIVIWDPSLSVVIYMKTDQSVLCRVFSPATNQEFTVAFIYTRNRLVQVRPL